MGLHAPWLGLLMCTAFLCACEGDHETTATSGEQGCAPGEYLREDGVCAAPGLPPDMPCPPGEWLRETDNACIPAGVPPDGCGPGFTHDGDRGCEPVLPPEPCPEGLMAVPGETRCRPIAPCGTTPWGDLPLESNTQYVDASFTGGDGSPGAPWTTVQEGVDAAENGAIVAVAQGIYEEDVIIENKFVRLWGRCPELVELRGTPSPAVAALFIQGAASGTEVRRIAIASQALGIALSGSENVLVEETWIHHNAARGIEAVNYYGPTSIVVRGSLLERNVQLGLIAIASGLEVDATVVRDTQPDALGDGGRGIAAQDDLSVISVATIRGSLVERNHEIGVIVVGSQANVDGTVVRDTVPSVGSGLGDGFAAEDDPETGARATVTVARSVIERNGVKGMAIYNSDLELDATVIRDTSANAAGEDGYGVTSRNHATTGARASFTVRRSLIDRNRLAGVYTFGSDLIVEASAVRDTAPDAAGSFGRGIAGEDDPISGARSAITVRSSVVERNAEVGVFGGGSDVTIETSVVRDTVRNMQSRASHAVHVQAHTETGATASVMLRSSLLERSIEAGFLVTGEATAEIHTSVVRETAAADGYLGDGMVAWSADGLTQALVRRTRIEASARAGVSSFGAAVTLEQTLLVCHGFDLAAESWMGLTAQYSDRGGVFCGCPTATKACRAQAYQLEPPDPLEP